MLAGTLGGMAFYAKPYAFPFFLLHFAVTSAVRVLGLPEGNRPGAVPRGAAGQQACSPSTTLPWVAVISMKYGHVTIGEAGRYARWLKGPGVDHAMHTLGFLPPPHDRAISVWEDISFTDLPAWSLPSQSTRLQYELRLLRTRVRQATRIFFRAFSYLSIPIVLLYLIHGLRSIVRSRDPFALLAVFTIAVYTSGYLFLWVIERYLWL